MYRGYKLIDVDSHMMEPEDLWEKYIDHKYRAYAPRHTCLAGDPTRFHFTLDIADHHFGVRTMSENPSYIPDAEGRMLTYGEAFSGFIEQGFSPSAYMEYMEWRNLEYIILYPTAGLFSAAITGLDPKTAAAIRRAYNDWLYDFCSEGDGRLIGVGSLDLRDVDLAVAEAQRCVNELGLKSLFILPDPPLEGLSLNDPYYDPLWSAIEELDVPLGIHEASGHHHHPPGLSQVEHSGIFFAKKAVTFHLGALVASLMFCGGGICARHPNLKVVFTESGAGWATSWLWYLDELWEREPGDMRWKGKHSATEEAPSVYFRRQCYISAEPEEPGIKYVIDAHGDRNILYNTDFPHPRESKLSNPADDFLGLDGISDESRRRILWDNAAALYKLT